MSKEEMLQFVYEASPQTLCVLEALVSPGRASER